MLTDPQPASSRIINNVLMNWLALAVSLGSGFLMSPFLVRNLGDSTYGVWVLVGSLVGYLGILDFGITPSIVKYVAEHRARGDQPAINRVVTAGVVVFSLLGLVCLAASVVVAFVFNSVFKSPLTDNTAAAVVFFAGTNLAISFPSSVFVGVVRGYQRYDLDAGVTAITILARTLLLVVLIRNGYGILTVAAVTFAFDMVRLAYLIRSAYRLNPAIRIAREYFDAGMLRKLFGYSVHIFVIVLSVRLIFYTDAIVIGFFLSTALVTVFFIAGRLISYLRTLVSDMVGVMTPTASDLEARDNREGINRLLVAGTKYTLLIALPSATVLFVMGERFIELWMGPGYNASALVLTILTIGTLVNLLEMPVDTVLRGLGKHRIVGRFALLQGIINLALSLVLVIPFGLIGVALATTIPMIVVTLFAFPVYFRELGLSMREWIRQSMPRALVVQAPFVAIMLALRVYARPASLLWFFVEVAAAFGVYAAIAVVVCMTTSERRAFLRAGDRFGLRLTPRYASR